MEEQHFYFSTLSSPTAITSSIKCKFNGEEYLLVSKSNILEFYKISEEGLVPLTSKQYSSSIKLLLPYKPTRSNDNYIIVITHGLELEIFTMTNRLVIISNCTIADSIGIPSYYGIKGTVSFDSKYLILNVYENMLKIFELPQNEKSKLISFNMKTICNKIISIQYCYLEHKSTIVILHEDKNGTRNINTFHILDTKELEKGEFSLPMLNYQTNQIIPLKQPLIGFLVIDNESICLISNANKKRLVKMDDCTITCYCFIDNKRILLADSTGNLHIVVLATNSRFEVVEITYRKFGSLKSPASTITYIDNKYLFYGSALGNSFILTMKGKILEEWNNYGPIIDARRIEGYDKYAVKCNGGNGRFGIIERGSKIEEKLFTEMEGIDKINTFVLNKKEYLFISVANEKSMLFEIKRDGINYSINEVTFSYNKNKCILCDVFNNEILQITDNEITVIKSDKCLFKSKKVITHAQISDNVIYFINDNQLKCIDTKCKLRDVVSFESDVSCLHINKEYICIGLWDGSVHIYDKLGKLMNTFEMQPEVPRSLYCLNDTLYIGIDDKVISIELKKQSRKEYAIQNLEDNKYVIRTVYDTICILSKTCYTIQSVGLVRLALENAIDMCETRIGVNGVIIATNKGIVIGEMGLLSRYCFRVEEYEQIGDKLAINDMKCLVVGEEMNQIDLTNGNRTEFHLSLKENEICTCVDNLDDGLYCIGTSVVDPTEVESSKGRIIIVKQIGDLITTLCDKEFDGTVYQVKKYNNYIVALINRHLHIIEKRGNELISKQKTVLRFIGSSLYIQNNLIIVGDIFKSIIVFVYKPELNRIDEFARDCTILSSTCVGALKANERNVFVNCDTNGNIIIYHPKTEAAMNTLEPISYLNVGDFINVIQPNTYNENSILFGGVSGALYSVTSISQENYEFLNRIQECLIKMKVMKSNWRQVITDTERRDMKNIIDGDKIEKILDWSDLRLNKLAKELGLAHSSEVTDRIKEITDIVYN